MGEGGRQKAGELKAVAGAALVVASSFEPQVGGVLGSTLGHTGLLVPLAYALSLVITASVQ